MSRYEELKKHYIKGWNTWNVNSVLSHVYMPDAFAVNLGIMEYNTGKYLREALASRQGDNCEHIRLGSRSYDGKYTSMEVSYKDVCIRVQTTTLDDNLIILIEPLKNQKKPATLIVECGFLWNHNGIVRKESDCIKGVNSKQEFGVYATGNLVDDPTINTLTPFYSLSLCDKIVISSGKKYTIDEAEKHINHQKTILEKQSEAFDENSQASLAIKSAIAWNTIYDPIKKRVITPVSRLWSAGCGGYVLFCWDNYFAGMLSMLENKFLAYANIIEITREATDKGFVPNMSTAMGVKSLDRLQPPVGSWAAYEVYSKYQEKWFLEEIYKGLLKWNEWFYENRRLDSGLFAWGSNPYEPVCGNYWESEGVNDRFGGALESGLDNSPMYDEATFNYDTHMLNLADVGLCGLYIMDCEYLEKIAMVLDDEKNALLLQKRKQETEAALKELWDEEFGFFLNLNTDNEEFSYRLSPTNFYALFSDGITQEQLDKIVAHFYNPEEFWGEWIIPSISRNDKAYMDQNYWRGRIWAPLNLLVYAAFKKHNQLKVCKDLAKKSMDLFMKEWIEKGHIHENYNAITGYGCDVDNSDNFYHWGGLLALISFI